MRKQLASSTAIEIRQHCWTVDTHDAELRHRSLYRFGMGAIQVAVTIFKESDAGKCNEASETPLDATRNLKDRLSRAPENECYKMRQ